MILDKNSKISAGYILIFCLVFLLLILSITASFYLSWFPKQLINNSASLTTNSYITNIMSFYFGNLWPFVISLIFVCTIIAIASIYNAAAIPKLIGVSENPITDKIIYGLIIAILIVATLNVYIYSYLQSVATREYQTNNPNNYGSVQAYDVKNKFLKGIILAVIIFFVIFIIVSIVNVIVRHYNNKQNGTTKRKTAPNSTNPKPPKIPPPSKNGQRTLRSDNNGSFTANFAEVLQAEGLNSSADKNNQSSNKKGTARQTAIDSLNKKGVDTKMVKRRSDNKKRPASGTSSQNNSNTDNSINQPDLNVINGELKNIPRPTKNGEKTLRSTNNGSFTANNTEVVQALFGADAGTRAAGTSNGARTGSRTGAGNGSRTGASAGSRTGAGGAGGGSRMGAGNGSRTGAGGGNGSRTGAGGAGNGSRTGTGNGSRVGGGNGSRAGVGAGAGVSAGALIGANSGAGGAGANSRAGGAGAGDRKSTNGSGNRNRGVSSNQNGVRGSGGNKVNSNRDKSGTGGRSRANESGGKSGGGNKTSGDRSGSNNKKSLSGRDKTNSGKSALVGGAVGIGAGAGIGAGVGNTNKVKSGKNQNNTGKSGNNKNRIGEGTKNKSNSAGVTGNKNKKGGKSVSNKSGKDKVNSGGVRNVNNKKNVGVGVGAGVGLGATGATIGGTRGKQNVKTGAGGVKSNKPGGTPIAAQKAEKERLDAESKKESDLSEGRNSYEDDPYNNNQTVYLIVIGLILLAAIPAGTVAVIPKNELETESVYSASPPNSYTPDDTNWCK